MGNWECRVRPSHSQDVIATLPAWHGQQTQTTLLRAFDHFRLMMAFYVDNFLASHARGREREGGEHLTFCVNLFCCAP